MRNTTTKRRGGYRKLMIGDEMWQWKAGEGVVVIYSPAPSVKTLIPLNEFLGLSWDTIERARHKHTCHEEVCATPGKVTNWIKENLL